MKLKCGDCGISLHSQSAISQHVRSTGHTNYEEDASSPLGGKEQTPLGAETKRCKDCSKVCETETEQQLHTKHTGHAQFESLQPASDAADPANNAILRIPRSFHDPLTEMGFSAVRIVHAYLNGHRNTNEALTWLCDHAEDAALDNSSDRPIEIVESVVPGEPSDAFPSTETPLTDEQRAEKEALVKQKLQQRKAALEKEQKELERVQELARLSSAKAMAAARQELIEVKRKQAADELRRQKEADRKAKQKVRHQILVDKYMKQGLDHAQACQKATEDMTVHATSTPADALGAEASSGLPAPSPALPPIRSSQPVSLSSSGGAPASTPTTPSLCETALTVRFVEHLNEAQQQYAALICQGGGVASFTLESFGSVSLKLEDTERALLSAVLMQVFEAPLQRTFRRLQYKCSTFENNSWSSRSVLYLLMVGFQADNEAQQLTMKTVDLRKLQVALSALTLTNQQTSL